jgi:hypothetical protein
MKNQKTWCSINHLSCEVLRLYGCDNKSLRLSELKKRLNQAPKLGIFIKVIKNAKPGGLV